MLAENATAAIPIPSYQPPIIATTTTTAMAMADTTDHRTIDGDVDSGNGSGSVRGGGGSSGGFVVGPALNNAKNRLWNRIRASSSSSNN